MRLNSNSTTQARCQIVAEHIGRENQHSLDGILATFGEAARYDDEPWDAHYVGLQEVRTFYTQLLQALPDLHIDVIRQHVAEHVIVVEVIIRGRHMGPWRGLPATGRRIEFPSAGFIRSIRKIGWPVRRFITIARLCFGSSAYFMSRRAYADDWRPQQCTHSPWRARSCTTSRRFGEGLSQGEVCACRPVTSLNFASARSNLSLNSHIASRISRKLADVFDRSACPKV